MHSSSPSRFLSDRRARVARALSGWARKRQGDDALPLTLQARRIYILPSGAGLVAGALLFLMLLAGMNYSNSLALLLCFLLTGVTLVSMHECHGALAGLRLLHAQADDTYAGRLGTLQLSFENLQTRARTGLHLRCPGCDASAFQVEAGGTQRVRALYQAGGRGRLRIDQLELSCDAPLGLFRAWTWLHLPLETIVYPQPRGRRRLPARRGDPRAGLPYARVAGEEEWAWLRPLRDSDPPRRIAWKAYARGAPLLVAQYDAAAGQHRWLDWEALRTLPLELSLSQLAQWVLDCERLGETYGLRLPRATVAVGHGIAHQRACLQALALHDA
jgi:uncharacterized protein (DUF58 family)